jgi:uncharacterized Ntn-hydrolase superfamily protein
VTWSLIARDPESRAFGIAVAKKNFAVGCRVSFICSSVGCDSLPMALLRHGEVRERNPLSAWKRK